jgi:hypothetical protein
LFCNDVRFVMEIFGHQYNSDRRRLFIDSSKVRLKAVLLHNRTRRHSVPLAHTVSMKETYECMKLLLVKIKYDEFKWKLRGELKVVACYSECNLGTQNTAVSCASGTAGTRRVNKRWPKRKSLTPREKNVVSSLVLLEKIYLPLCT